MFIFNLFRVKNNQLEEVYCSNSFDQALLQAKRFKYPIEIHIWKQEELQYVLKINDGNIVGGYTPPHKVYRVLNTLDIAKEKQYLKTKKITKSSKIRALNSSFKYRKVKGPINPNQMTLF